jgi:cell wall-associated NlpC family hydrolase
MNMPGPLTMPTGWADVVTQARTHLGTPWVHQGRQPGVGLDCVGLAVVVARELGIATPDATGYGRHPDGVTLLATLRATGWAEVPPRAGCVALMSFRRGPQHVGLLVPYLHGGLGLLHALSTRGQVVEHRLDDRWRSHIVGCWALPGVDYSGAMQ